MVYNVLIISLKGETKFMNCGESEQAARQIYSKIIESEKYKPDSQKEFKYVTIIASTGGISSSLSTYYNNAEKNINLN